MYSCITCLPKSKDDPKLAAAICLACSNNCHEDHKTIELYTKRDTRCDCGIKGLPTCSLRPKTLPNTENYYNQNYSGLYCTCHRPYPDPEDETPDEMLQCIVCEDWYHGRHLNALLPSNDSFSEVICQICMGKHEFLAFYTGLSIQKSVSDDSVGALDVKGEDTEKSKEDPGTSSSSSEPVAKRAKLDVPVHCKEGDCKKPTAKADDYKGGCTFWPQDWRKFLCQCQDCMKVYEKEKVKFLLDLEDTVHFYEAKGKKQAKSGIEIGMAALSSLDHTRQIEAITGYNQMKSRLMNYLQSFVVNRTIVTEDDINKFFNSMKEDKKKGFSGGPPSTCR